MRIGSRFLAAVALRQRCIHIGSLHGVDANVEGDVLRPLT
jgi:hypothetical protein